MTPPAENLADLHTMSQHCTDKFSEGERRMQRIEEDLRPITKIYNAIVGIAAAGAVIAILAGKIYFDDRENNKNLVDAVTRLSHSIEKMVIKHEELEKDTSKNFQRIEKEIERRHGH